jgi:alanyl-tRNA synthetase
MESKEIRKIFLEFFEQKGHIVVPSSSLIPADPTVLFTSAGMQQFIPYLSGEVVPPYQRVTSLQKCFRTSDIENIGSPFHHTFFEMLGNWSFGDYWKEEAIEWALELLTSKFNFPISKLWVTVFKGEGNIPRDEEAIKIWQKLGIPKERIKEFGPEDNFWGPISEEGPCGPCSEIHYDRGEEFKVGKCDIKGCGPNCSCRRFVEIWNLVFMQYNRKIKVKKEKGENGYEYIPLPAKNIDTGAGLERWACILQNKKTNFETDLFLPIIKKIEEFSEFPYDLQPKPYRIIADHLRASCFLISEGILPSKEDRGYILRRILRRSIRYGNLIKAKKGFLIPLANLVIDNYKDFYPELNQKRNDILTVIQQEEEKFEKTLSRGLKEFEKIISLSTSKKISGKDVFHLYDTFGFPVELTEELAKEKGFQIDKEGFKEAFIKHQEISRAGVEKKFGGHGLVGAVDEESKIKITRLHTATHLLHSALRQVLGNHVQQAGSDINPERLRFDFTHPKKLTDEEIKKVEEIVNQKIKENLEVKIEEMAYEEAIKSGALAFFKERYPKIVKVYSIGNFSKEICAGPHVKNTSELGQFKIIKEEASMAGVRRIKARLLNL